MGDRIGGIIFGKINGEQMRLKGSWTYNLGQPKRDGVVGADGVHGFADQVQVPFFEGAISDSGDTDLKALLGITDATLTLELANGKVIVLRSAWFAGEGNVTTEQGEIDARFEGMRAEEVV